MTKSSNIQYRGHCQVCGRQHAITNTRTAKHGYTVDWGQFNGVCRGAGEEPIETNIDLLTENVARLRHDAAHLVKLAAKYEAKTAHPELVAVERYCHEERKRVKDMKPWDEVEDYVRNGYRETLTWNFRSHSKAMYAHADMLENLADLYHGKPLAEVVKADKPNPIRVGEVRKSGSGEPQEVTDVQGARVYWKIERGDKTLKGWTGTGAFRKQDLLQA